jgi:antitoxin ParD1/3/4
MNVNLTPRLEEIVRGKVETGLYNNASEVVREAIRQMDERDRYQRLKIAIAEGMAEDARGETMLFTADLVEEMKQDASRLAREGAAPDPDVCS